MNGVEQGSEIIHEFKEFIIKAVKDKQNAFHIKIDSKGRSIEKFLGCKILVKGALLTIGFTTLSWLDETGAALALFGRVISNAALKRAVTIINYLGFDPAASWICKHIFSSTEKVNKKSRMSKIKPPLIRR